ncbi:MAG: hypothetical protein OXF85_03185 [Candidatus Saccharibacteria bacterium]|nr:hypothetical protein [Candidatus Saccharibacteria bacterium]
MGKLHRNQIGDTLASISISLVVIGTVITISYVLINRVFRQNQQAKEREQIIKVVQSQIEGLKARAIVNDVIFQSHPSNPTPHNHGDHRWFCIDDRTLIKYPTYQYPAAFDIGNIPKHLPQVGDPNYKPANALINNSNFGEDLNNNNILDSGAEILEDQRNNDSGTVDNNYSFAHLCGVDLASLDLDNTNLEIGIRRAQTQTTGDPIFVIKAVWQAYTGGFDQIEHQIGLINIHQWRDEHSF